MMCKKPYGPKSIRYTHRPYDIGTPCNRLLLQMCDHCSIGECLFPNREITQSRTLQKRT